MALFTRRPQIGDTAVMYETGLETSLIIIGLGNVGKEYDGTRHNIGFNVLDHFARKQDFPDWTIKKDLKCVLTAHTLGSAHVILVKPTTFMNHSGEALQAVQNFYKVSPSHTLAVYDELDVNFGQIRLRKGGSSAGHNGVKSLVQHTSEEFSRVRIGIGPKKPAQMDSSDYVLASFSAAQKKEMPLLLQEVTSILSEYSYGNGQLFDETRSFLI